MSQLLSNSQPALEILGLHQSFADQDILKSVELSVKEGQIICLLGPSGCGKTTLLRCIAGFESIRKGAIRIKGEVVSTAESSLAPEKRGIGVVFQDYALFPHMTVEQNIAFGIQNLPQAKRKARVEDLLRSVEMLDHIKKFPRELSGGQQQRVALARALAPEPKLLLLDEPFSHLDPSLREKMKQELKALLKGFGVTAILVTHDQDEAFDLADEVALMIDGRIAQFGTSQEIYFHPNSRAVADFIGDGFYLPAMKQGSHSLMTELGELKIETDLQNSDVLLRPDDLEIDSSSPYKVDIERVSFRGTHQIIQARLKSGRSIQFLVTHRKSFVQEASQVGVRLAIKASPVVFG